MSDRQFDRHDRVRSHLREKVAEFIRNEANDDPLITVTKLTISPDYKYVTVFVTTIPEGDAHESRALAFLKRKGSDLRTFVKTHSAMKALPFFSFEIDYGERHRQHIDEVARRIEKGE
jgi:ribosome-binding factor A